MIKIEGKPHDLGGGMLIHRLLPDRQKRLVGPFCFLDRMGPFTAVPNQNTDVRPHPHIGLSTLTYLLAGRMVHKDSLGSEATIVPGDVNWMTAGRGISHSERAHPEDKKTTHTMHGLQFWIALPDGAEEVDPSFRHYPSADIPEKENTESKITVIAGEGFGLKSSVKVSSPLVLANIEAKKEFTLATEFPSFEIALAVLKGSIECEGQSIIENQLVVFERGAPINARLAAGSQVVLLGGEPFSSPRYMWWNLVSSSKERIEVAKKQWRDGNFPMVPGETEFIPLPE